MDKKMKPENDDRPRARPTLHPTVNDPQCNGDARAKSATFVSGHYPRRGTKNPISRDSRPGGDKESRFNSALSMCPCPGH